MQWTIVNGDAEMLGYIPEFLNESDPRSAREQLDGAYAHGGGWNAFSGFKLNAYQAPKDWRLLYPGDPPMRILAFTNLPLTGETVAVFEHAWVAIVDSNGIYEIARMD